MMMKWTHLKDPLAASALKVGHLHDDRDHFGHEKARYQNQHHRSAEHESHSGKRSTKGQTSGVAHEHFGGVAVVPEEAKQAPDQAKRGDYDSWLLLQHTQGHWRALYGTCAVFVALAGLALVVRATLSWQSPPGTPMQDHPVMGLVFLLLLTHNLAWICGMSLAVNLSVQERLQQMALIDPLTGLANRRQLDSFAAQALRRAQRHGDHLAVVLLDLDGFKGLNDRHGHAAGDGVLREVAQRARQATRETDLVARLGGDEFVVVLEASSPQAVQAAVARLRSTLDASPLFDGPPTPVGISMGVACFPEDGDNLVALLREADGRMYGQKRERASITQAPHSGPEPA